jgi:hypothetical protein
VSPSSSARLLARSLAGYLCGTHSGMLARRQGDRLDVGAMTRAHRELSPPPAQATVRLGTARWEPPADARGLRRKLRGCLEHSAVIELVLFGSQARGGTTGFSDVDAILVIEDGAAERPATLRALRHHVMAAQRAVVSHQPMQHHGFEVVTPKLLRQANDALAMPAPALSETRSLGGRAVDATFGPDGTDATRGRLSDLVTSTVAVSTWPRHAWQLHHRVSMFELLPTLYLQALGHVVPKWRSFEEARGHFGDAYWPYDVLRKVREAWVRTAPPTLRTAVTALRNPWLAIAGWSRLPAQGPNPARSLLSAECLAALRHLALEMGARAC